MEAVRLIGSILLLIAGAVYPLAAIYRLAGRLNRMEEEPITPLGTMIRLLLIATVPMAGILGGFAGINPDVWESTVMRVVILSAALVSVAGWLILIFLSRSAEAGPGR